MTGLTATPQQAEWIEKFVESSERGGILGLGMGTGKTLVGTEIARLRNAERVLILAPEATIDGWMSTVFWQTGRRLKRAANNGITFAFTPDPNERTKIEHVKLSVAHCKKNLEDVQAGLPGWYFVTRELFTLQDWDKVPVKKDGKEVIDPKTGKPKMRRHRKNIWHKKGAFDVAILDENQKFATKGNYGQQSWAALDAKFSMPMSADWFGSAIVEAHTVAVDTFGREAIGMTRATYIDTYLTTEFDPFSYDKKRVTGEQIPGLFAASLPLYVTSPPSVVPPEPEVRHVTLSKDERGLYDSLEANFVAMIDEEVLAVEIPLVLRIRLRELSLGMFKVVKTGQVSEDGIEKVTIEFPPGAKSSKLDEIRSILSEHPDKKYLIYSHSAKWCEFAANELTSARAWTGNQSSTERAEIKDDFVRGDLRIIVATPGAVGTGVDSLQLACSKIIFASRDDQSLSNQQAIGRIARTGQKEQVEVIDLQARATFDSGQLRNLKNLTTKNNQAKGWA